MNWYLAVLKNYVGFDGRARRTEYWMFALIQALISIVLQVIGSAALDGNQVLGLIYSLATLLPSLAVGVRRLHDTNRSGWWLLIGLVPIVGAILLLVWFATAGTTGPNEHGPDPKQAPAPA